MDESNVCSLDLPELEDPYGQFDKIKEKFNAQKQVIYNLPAGARGRKTKTGCKLKIEPLTDNPEERYLPPGHCSDYYEQYLLETCDSGDKVSFVTFWRTWYTHFNHMKFRHQTNHSVCAVCLHCKLLIREMAGFLKAREAQRLLLVRHLQSQYRDRSCYWEGRAQSRIKSHGLIQVIIDSMDQQKFAFPRGAIYQGKHLSGFNRPRAHCTAVICHGFFILVTISEHSLPKNASCMIEILSYCLHLLRTEHGVDTSAFALRVQSDNTVRECKNNVCLKWMSWITMNGSSACFRIQPAKVTICLLVVL